MLVMMIRSHVTEGQRRGLTSGCELNQMKGNCIWEIKNGNRSHNNDSGLFEETPVF